LNKNIMGPYLFGRLDHVLFIPLYFHGKTLGRQKTLHLLENKLTGPSQENPPLSRRGF